MGDQDRELTIRIVGKNLSADEMAKVRGQVEGVRDAVTRIGPEGQQSMSALRRAVDDLLPSTKNANVMFGDVKSTLTDLQHEPLAAVKSLGGALGTDLVGGMGAAGVASAGLAAGLVVAVGVAEQLAAKAAKVGAELNDMSEKTGISVPKLSQWRFALGVAGSDLGQFSTAVFMLEKNVAEGGPKIEAGLGRIGLTLDGIRKQTPDEMFLSISRGFNAITDPATRAAAAVEIFGKPGRELLPLLSKDLDGLIERGKTLGVTWSTEDAQAAEAFEMKTAQLRLELERSAEVIGKDLIPAFNVGLDLANWTVAKFLIFGPDVLQKLTLDAPVSALGPLASVLNLALDFSHWSLARFIAEAPDKAAALYEKLLQLSVLPVPRFLVTEITPPKPPEAPATTDFGKQAAADLKASTAEMTAQTLAADALATHLRQLREATSSLNPLQREMATLMHQGGDSAQDIARWLGVSQKAVENFLEAQKREQDFAKKSLEGWRNLTTALDDLDGGIEEEVRHWLSLGKSQADIAAAYGLTAEQVKVVAERMKLEKEVLNAWKKSQDDLLNSQKNELEILYQLDEILMRGLLPDGTLFGRMLGQDLKSQVQNFGTSLDFANQRAKELLKEIRNGPSALQAFREVAHDVAAELQQMSEAPGAGEHLRIAAQIATAWEIAARQTANYNHETASALDKVRLLASAVAAVWAATGQGNTTQRTLSGAVQGAEFGNALWPGWGALIGAGIGAFIGWMRGKAMEADLQRARFEFVNAAGGVDQLSAALLAATGNMQLLNYLMATDTAEGYADAVQKIRDALEKFQQMANQVEQHLTSIKDRMLQQVYISPELEAALKKAYDAKTPKEYADALDEIDRRLTEQEMHTKRLDELIQKYGLSWEELGAKARGAKLNQTLQELLDDFQELLFWGTDINVIWDHMKDKILDVIRKAQELGIALPAAWRKLIQQLIDAGLLLDANGNKITDIDQLGLTFGEDAESVADRVREGFDKLLQKFDEVFQKLLQILNTILKIPSDVNTTVHVFYDDQGNPQVPGGSGGGGNNPPDQDSGKEFLPAGGRVVLEAHARGGIFSRSHFAMIAEGGRPEAVGNSDFIADIVRAVRRADAASGVVSSGAARTSSPIQVFVTLEDNGRQVRVKETQAALADGQLVVPVKAITQRVR